MYESRVRVVGQLSPTISYIKIRSGAYVNPFIHYCSHVVTKFNSRVIYTYGI
jgi:hypothetical protein